MVIRGNSWSFVVTRGHSWSFVVIRGHSWSLVVTRGHSWSLVVTRGHSWSLVCTFRQDRDFQMCFVISKCVLCFQACHRRENCVIKWLIVFHVLGKNVSK